MTLTSGTKAYIANNTEDLISAYESMLNEQESKVHEEDGVTTKITCIATYLFRKEDGVCYTATTPFNIDNPDKPFKEYAPEAVKSFKEKFSNTDTPLYFEKIITKVFYTHIKDDNKLSSCITLTRTARI